MYTETVDVIVIGSGNAGFSAAASAKEHGARSVALLEKPPQSWAGGNSTFTAGAYRTVFYGLRDVLSLPVHNVTPEMVDLIDMQPYLEKDFVNDLMRLKNGRCDPKLAEKLVKASNETMKWLSRNGIRFCLSFNRQSYNIDGRHKFWGEPVLVVEGGGSQVGSSCLAAVKWRCFPNLGLGR